LLAEAMEARGFGTGARTRSSIQEWRTRDVAVAVSAGAAIAIFAAALLLGRAGGWQPYPTLELPGMNWLPLLACLLLLVPAVAG
jgi:hypothetical protein